ncbi:MAG: glycosyltransferase family 4 protein [Polaromonas sp.]
MTESRGKAALPMGRVIAFPKSGISYNDCFYRCVQALRVRVVEGMFTGRWLWGNLRRGDWVHLHWPSFAYNTQRGEAKLLWTFARWVALMTLVRMRGGKIVWTAHNLLPHDRAAIPWLDVLARRLVIAFSARIMVHGQLAAECVTARFPAAAGKLCLIPHGNWIDYYPLSMSRETARFKLGLPPDRFVFLFIGLCKPYKNLDGLVRAFRAAPADTFLLIAGKFPDKTYYEQVKELSGGDQRIRIEAGFVPDEMMQCYLLACDVVVVPYREILTSGTAMLAMSFGRPVVSVALGFLKDVINPQVGLLFSPTAPTGLLDALVAAPTLHFSEEEILAHARSFSFEKAASRFVASLRDCG